MGMDFPAYRQGFVRVAPARTTRCWRTRPPTPESVVRLANLPRRRRRRGGVPQLTLSGYSIEDILLQDTLLDAVEDALLDVVAASGGPATRARGAAALPAPDLTTQRW